ncbi:MAG TPA: V-type ATP synthase subunit F [Candidatus Kryptonia bacterium]|nr:V-type ATP synthase subunit F [Candidatus Kryptonia bacterium]
MKGIHVIGDADTVLAFALGGVSGSTVTTAAEVRVALAAATDVVRAQSRTARQPLLLLVSRAAATLVGDELRTMTLDPKAPLILVIPGYAERGGGVADDFVERALGVRL